MLAKSMNGILSWVIGEAQSALVPGRLITDNVLVAYESVHRIKRKKGNHGLWAVKLDMHKAYDRVEWCFLEGIMLRMGFDVRWVELMMACVKSVTYSVRFNSQITERFIPSRGLRQGDPLSPYFFFLVNVHERQKRQNWPVDRKIHKMSRWWKKFTQLTLLCSIRQPGDDDIDLG